MVKRRKITEKAQEDLPNSEAQAKVEVEESQKDNVETSKAQKPLSKVPGKLRKFL